MTRFRPLAALAPLVLSVSVLPAQAVPMATAAAAASATVRGTPDSFADLVENVMPAVVNISTVAGGRPVAPSPNGEPRSLGSGFIIDKSGIVVTNDHVVRVGDVITVTLENGKEYPARKIGSDRETDLAVLKIDGPATFPAVRFGNSDRLRVGEWVVAIGQPFGLGGSVSAGIVSAKSRDIDSGLYDDFIQTDAAINRGNSGGPLFDMSGRVVGVNTVIFAPGGGSVGVGFAVPGTLAERVVRQLIEFGETQRGFLGVLLEEVTPADKARLRLPNTDGALVVGVPAEGTPAARAGIRENDVIIRFDGKEIEQQRELTRAVAETRVGSTVPVVIIRSGQRVTLEVNIARRETLTAQRGGAVDVDGLTLQAANIETKALYGLPDAVDGVIVTHVEGTSPLSGTLRQGDVIFEIGDIPVNDPQSVAARIAALRAAGAGPVELLVRRGDQLFDTYLVP